jgi:NAD(P)H-quinone oxidoreductase subunit 5
MYFTEQELAGIVPVFQSTTRHAMLPSFHTLLALLWLLPALMHGKLSRHWWLAQASAAAGAGLPC